MTDCLKVTYFLNRIRSLQRLCSSCDPSYPRALLFIPGIDGRNNKGSITVLKYLFTGSVGKDLFEDTFDPEYDSLDDIVLLIEERNVSVMWRFVLNLSAPII